MPKLKNLSEKPFLNSILVTVFIAGTVFSASAADTWQYHSTSDGSEVTPRHEAASVVIGKKLYIIGGRGLRPLEALDTNNNKWSTVANSSYEINHFQPVVWNGKIYAIGAFTGPFPNETNVPNVKIFDPATKTWSDGASIPEARRRGSTGAVVYDNKIYIHGGNTNGHDGGGVPWFDEYDPATNEWKILPDSPNARDHYTAAVVGNRFVAAGGRNTHYPNFLGNKVSKVDVYNFSTGKWETNMDNIPTARAGTATVAHNNEVIVIGGEATAGDAESAVEALNTNTGKWRTMPSLLTTRHGMGAGIIDDVLYVASGNRTVGGGKELSTTEIIELDADTGGSGDSDNDGLTDDEENNTYNTDPNKADTDDDTLTDGSEVNDHNTDPLKADSDNDSLEDGDEVNFYNTDPLDSDTDNDTLSDADEINIHNTDPNKSDSDDDTLSDADEINTHETDPLKADSDSDGLNDNDEINVHQTNPQSSDSDADTISDFDEINQHQSDPNKADTDDDTLTDAEELQHGTDLLKSDTDGDGISDAKEISQSTDPNDADDPGEETGGAEEKPEESDSENTGATGLISLLMMLVALYGRRRYQV